MKLSDISWLWLVALPCTAMAGGISVMPTRIDFSAGRGVQSVLVTNTSAQTITLETQVMVWPEGAKGQLANDIVVNPAVVTLPPDQRIRLRVGLVRPQETNIERSYRLYFTELSAPASLQGAGIGVRLRVGVPIFVEPVQPQAVTLRWVLRQGEQGTELVAHNDGNVHARITDLRLTDALHPLTLPSTYVLAKSTLVVPIQHNPATSVTRIRWQEAEGAHENTVEWRP